VPEGGTTKALAQNVDITPTVLELLDVPPPKGVQGVSLVPAFRGKRSPRKRVFFDTTPGGHLTPEARKLERLEGVGDGVRIHVERIGAERKESDASAPELEKDLARWRDAQARARVKVVAEYGGVVRPDPKEVDSWAETLAVVSPADGAQLTFHEAQATIRVSWEGERRDEPPWWVEYRIGTGILSASGMFSVEEPRVFFGPFPVAFWNDLSSYSPYRFRVLDPTTKSRSAWQSFTVEKAGP